MDHYHNDDSSRQALVDAMLAMGQLGLNKGSSGNASARTATGMLVTPTGIPPSRLQARHIVHMDLDGEADAGQLIPSSEWRMHADVYREKPEIGAVVHCHSPYATILACARKSIPAMHYMVAAAGGHGIPLADYATFGSRELSQANLRALAASRACLLANHGQLAVGEDLDGALKLAELVEEQAQCYWGTLAIGGPVVLDRENMDEVLRAFSSYGQQRAPD